MASDSGAQTKNLEGLIDWIRTGRTNNPTTSLADLLAGHQIDPGQLVDLACIDLMERRRSGQAIQVEHYSLQFPSLKHHDRMLDLIDAELCVAIELGQEIDADDYRLRFPELAEQIDELIRLEDRGASQTGTPLQTSTPLQTGTPGEADERNPIRVNVSRFYSSPLDRSEPMDAFSDELIVPKEDASNPRPPLLEGEPLRTPDWFSIEQYVSIKSGHWLIRGRDSRQGEPTALKAIRLSDGLTATRIEQMLDACESAARVRNPGWVTPSVAAIQNRHFVMVRPWIFGIAWLPAIATHKIATQLNELASLAYTLEAAHQTGAAHGGLNANNLLLDHDGTLRVVDATCNHNAIQRWINPSLMTPNESSVLSKSERQKLDLDDLIRLISSHVANWQQPWTYRLIGELGRVGESSNSGSAADLGDLLMRYADSPAGSCFIKKSTRGFWKNCLGKP